MPYKIIYTSDLHGNKEFYKKLINKAIDKEIKAVIIGGDLCPRINGSVEQIIEYQKKFLKEFFIPELNKLNKDIFVIMGNDDFRINETILKNQKNNLKYLSKKCYKIYNCLIVGYSFVNPTPFRLKDWEKPEDNINHKPKQIFNYEIRSIEKETGNIKDDLKQIKKLSDPKKTIYVMHAPPYDTNLDIITEKIHVGSKSIREFIENEKPLLTLHGHIHESPVISGKWKDKINQTVCINVGSSYPKLKLNSAIIDLDTLEIKYLEI